MFMNKPSYLSFRAVFVTAICTSGVAANDLNRYEGVGPDVICVYPISGIYDFMQRLLFYALLLFAAIARRQRWLVFGALASAMSYSGAASIHALLLVVQTPTIVDMDIYGIFAVTSSGIMFTAPLLNWSTTLLSMEKRRRYIVMLWGAMMLLGAAATTACMFIREAAGVDPACLTSAKPAFPGVSQFQNPTGNCTYTCFPEPRLLRWPRDVMAWPNSISRARDMVGIFLPTTSCFLLAWLLGEVAARTWMREKISQNINSYLATSATASEVLGLRWITRRFQTRNKWGPGSPSPPASISSSSATSPCHRWWKSFLYYGLWGNVAAFAANVIMTEYRIYSFPQNEHANEIGQWAPWVSVALLVLAQALNHFAKMKGWGRDPILRSRFDEERTLDAGEPCYSLEKRIRSEITVSRSDTMGSKRRNSF